MTSRSSGPHHGQEPVPGWDECVRGSASGTLRAPRRGPQAQVELWP
jgi:hypothetical protein